jgi:hypothetical protein
LNADLVLHLLLLLSRLLHHLVGYCSRLGGLRLLLLQQARIGGLLRRGLLGLRRGGRLALAWNDHGR